MASVDLQAYVFDNKEQLPDGIYKGLQDLLQKIHEEEIDKELFEVKYIEIEATSKIKKSKYKKVNCKLDYDWDSESEFDEEEFGDDNDPDADDEYVKFAKKRDNYNVFTNNSSLTITDVYTKICKTCEESRTNCDYSNWYNKNQIEDRVYGVFKKNGVYKIRTPGIKNISRNPHHNTIAAIEKSIVIIDIKPYKP